MRGGDFLVTVDSRKIMKMTTNYRNHYFADSCHCCCFAFVYIILLLLPPTHHVFVACFQNPFVPAAAAATTTFRANN